jgi:hypothetical protein
VIYVITVKHPVICSRFLSGLLHFLGARWFLFRPDNSLFPGSATMPRWKFDNCLHSRLNLSMEECLRRRAGLMTLFPTFSEINVWRAFSSYLGRLHQPVAYVYARRNLAALKLKFSQCYNICGKFKCIDARIALWWREPPLFENRGFVQARQSHSQQVTILARFLYHGRQSQQPCTIQADFRRGAGLLPNFFRVCHFCLHRVVFSFFPLFYRLTVQTRYM